MTQTVKNDCKHEDCMYRGYMRSTDMHFCKYLMVTGEARGCDISNCDKYEKGTLKPKSTLGGLWYSYKKEKER